MEKEGATVGATDHIESLSTEVEDDDFNFSFGKLMAMLSFQLGYMADVFILSMAATVLTTINDDIGPSKNYTWIITAQILGQSVLAPIIGRLGDIFGRRNFLLLGNCISILADALCATSNDVNRLIGASTLIGIASSMHQLAWSCLGEVVPKRSRGMAIGFFQLSLLPAAGFAPVIAYSFIAAGYGWRPVYWLPFALNSTALFLIFFFYRPKNQYIREEGKTVWGQVLETDFIGLFIFTAGMTLLLLGVSFGGTQYPWRSAGTIAPIVIGFALLLLTGFYEAYADIKYPCFPPAIFRNIRGFTVIIIGVFLLGMLYYSSAVLWPLQVQTLYATKPSIIGWYATATGLGGSVISPIIGYLFQKIGKGHIILPTILGTMTLFAGLMAIASPTSNKASTAFIFIIGGCVGSSAAVSTGMVQIGVKHEYIGVATGLLIGSRASGGAIATVIYTTILQQRFTANLVPDVATPLALSGVAPTSIPAVLAALLGGDSTSPVLATLKPTQLLVAIHGITNAYQHAFKVVYLVSVAFGVLGTIAVCFCANIDHLMTKKVDIKLEEGAHIHSHNTDTGEGHILKAGEKS